MEFKIERPQSQAIQHYSTAELDASYEFSKRVYTELGSFVKAIVLFGGVARRKSKKADIDILLVVDDISIVINDEIVEAYRVIVEKIVVDVNPNIHVTTLKLTSFWEFVRAGDPVAVNILRDGVPLIDTGFIEPLQALLIRGRIRPSPEAVVSYYGRAPITLANSKWHLIQAVLDLYWAVIDSAHAILMSLGEIPPSPDHVAEMMDEKLRKKGLLEKKYVDIMQNFYALSKKIIYSEIREIPARDYERYYQDAHDFVHRMRKFLKEKGFNVR